MGLLLRKSIANALRKHPSTCRTRPESTWICTSQGNALRAIASSPPRTTLPSRWRSPTLTRRPDGCCQPTRHTPSVEPSAEWESQTIASTDSQRKTEFLQRTSNLRVSCHCVIMKQNLRNTVMFSSPKKKKKKKKNPKKKGFFFPKKKKKKKKK